MKSKKYNNLESLAPRLPRHSYSIRTVQMEPICLIILGNKRQVKKSFARAGWYLADPINILSSLRSLTTTALNGSYNNGPMWPAFVNGKQHQLGYEKPTASDTYRRRHHLRLWKTNYNLAKKKVWVGTISYDRSIGHFKDSLMPTHHISPALNLESDFLARTFGIEKPMHISLGRPEQGVINTGDKYVWDGRALVMDLTGL